MATLFDRIVAPPEVEERFGADQLVELLRLAQYTPSPEGSQRIAPSLSSLVALGLKGNGIVFGCASARMLLFSEAEFKWQNLSDRRLFGDDGLGLLERPWRNGTTGELLGLMEVDASFAGNSFWVRSFYADGAREEYLKRLRPDWVDLIVEGYEVVAYAYWEGGHAATGEPVVYTPEDVAHYSPLPDPLEPYKGMSWLTPILREIDADSGFTEHRHKSVDKSAVVPYAISYPEMTKERFEETIAAFNAVHQGRKNAWQPLHLSGGADVKTLGMSLKDMDYKAVQALGETRICVAARVPAVIAGVSEGLGGSSLNQGNYGMARRQFGDGFAHPHWRMAAGTLTQLVTPPSGARLWYDATHVAFLHEDQKDLAEIQRIQAVTIRNYTDAGYTAESAVAAVVGNDPSQLVHSGLFSVQLQPPGTNDPAGTPTSPPADEEDQG